MPVDNEIHKAAHKGDVDAIKNLVETTQYDETPLTVNDLGASDRRPLHRGAGSGHLDVCTYLLEAGAEIDAKDKSGRTALHWAAIGGHCEVMTFLLKKGCDILAETASKNNALHVAVEAGRVDAVKLLIEFAVSIDEEKKKSLTNLLNSEEKTPWGIAFGAKNKALCQALKDAGDENGASSSCSIS